MKTGPAAPIHSPVRHAPAPPGSGASDGEPSLPSQPVAGDTRLLASARHTWILVAIVLGIAAVGAFGAGRAGGAPATTRVPQYLALIAAEWLLLRYTLAGVRRRGLGLRDLIGERWGSLRGTFVALGVAALFWLLASVVLDALKSALDHADSARVLEARRLTALVAPHGVVEAALWIALSISAGFCEEVVFRGYLQRQFAALARHPVVGVVGSALVFGVSHGYQGPRSVLIVTIYGLLFGGLAQGTRSLRPGIAAHAWQDLFAGLIRR